MDALRLTNVSREFGGVRALWGVSLEVADGARHVVLGPNGAGKTTLFRVICGEMAPTTGRVELSGEDVTRLPVWARARRGLGRTFQVSTLFQGLSVEQSARIAVASAARARRRFWSAPGADRRLREQARKLLDEHALAGRADECVADLSYGEQRQLELALALARKPRLLLLDEPTAGLARDATEGLIERMAALPPTVTLIVIEHDLEVAFRLSGTATVLHFGEVVAHGSVRSIRANSAVQQLYLGKPHDEPATRRA